MNRQRRCARTAGQRVLAELNPAKEAANGLEGFGFERVEGIARGKHIIFCDLTDDQVVLRYEEGRVPLVATALFADGVASLSIEHRVVEQIRRLRLCYFVAVDIDEKTGNIGGRTLGNACRTRYSELKGTRGAIRLDEFDIAEDVAICMLPVAPNRGGALLTGLVQLAPFELEKMWAPESGDEDQFVDSLIDGARVERAGDVAAILIRLELGVCCSHLSNDIQGGPLVVHFKLQRGLLIPMVLCVPGFPAITQGQFAS